MLTPFMKGVEQMASKYDENKQTWVKRIEEQKDSGLSVQAWCKREGVNESGFYRNRRRVSEPGEPQAKLIAVPMSKGADRGSPLDDESRTSASETRLSSLEIQTPEGFVIRLSSRAQLEWLPRLLAVL
jgi:hypothetical protein